MGGHFKLDVDVGALKRARRSFASAATHLGERGRHLRGAPGRWAGDWTGGPADRMAAQTRDLAKDARTFSDHFTEAADAAKVFIGAAERAEDVTLPDLNRRWREAGATYDSAVSAASTRAEKTMDNLPNGTTGQARKEIQRQADDARTSSVGSASSALSAARSGLEVEYDEMVNHLKRAAGRLGSALQGAVALSIPIEQAGNFTFRALQAHPAGALPSDEKYSELRELAADTFGGPAHALLDDLDTPSTDLAEVKEMLDEARALGLRPLDYAATLEQFWFLEAAAKASIDVDRWNPELGASFNEETIMKVYRYYGDLYLENADLQWAGMANMIGPSFAGGFLDLSMLRDFAKAVEKFPPSIRPFDRKAMSALAGLTDEDLEFYETTLLSMQKEIFHDQGTMHEAYRTGGMDAIEEMFAAGILDRDTYESWQGIDSGDIERVQAGNEQFLYREQWNVIQDDYQRLYDHGLTGPVVTWGMTQIGAPSIPGAQSYAKIDPVTVHIPTPGPSGFGIPFTDIGFDNPLQGDVLLDTPFAEGNVAHFDDRWKLIEQDTLPAYQTLLRDDPELARALISADVAGRVEEYRLSSTWDDILKDFITDWEVSGFEQ